MSSAPQAHANDARPIDSVDDYLAGLIGRVDNFILAQKHSNVDHTAFRIVEKGKVAGLRFGQKMDF